MPVTGPESHAERLSTVQAQGSTRFFSERLLEVYVISVTSRGSGEGGFVDPHALSSEGVKRGKPLKVWGNH